MLDSNKDASTSEAPISDASNPFAAPRTSSEPPVVGSEVTEPINPWRDLWLKPRTTMAYLATQPWHGVLPVIALYAGVNFVVNYGWWLSLVLTDSRYDIGELAIDAGERAIKNVLIQLFLTALLYASFRLLHGKGTLWDTLVAILWSNLPVIVGSAFWLPLTAFEIAGTVDAETLPESVLRVPTYAGYLLSMWSAVTLCHMSAAGHGVSSRKGIVALLTTFLFTVGIVAIVLQLFPSPYVPWYLDDEFGL